jgi:hypothetical protein
VGKRRPPKIEVKPIAAGMTPPPTAPGSVHPSVRRDHAAETNVVGLIAGGVRPAVCVQVERPNIFGARAARYYSRTGRSMASRCGRPALCSKPYSAANHRWRQWRTSCVRAAESKFRAWLPHNPGSGTSQPFCRSPKCHLPDIAAAQPVSPSIFFLSPGVSWDCLLRRSATVQSVCNTVSSSTSHAMHCIPARSRPVSA